MLSPIIVALDTDTDFEAIELVDKLAPYVDIFKVGPALYYRYGSRVVREIGERRKKVFMDMKLFDIPNTAELAVDAICSLNVYSVSVHLSGGGEMLERIISMRSRPLIWGISVLTSFNDMNMEKLGISGGVASQVSRLVELGLKHKVDGVVSSAHELERIVELRKKNPESKDAKLIVPGIRLEKAGKDKVENDDQQRVMTPADAMKLGADFLVIGRPIIKADDPVGVVKKILEDISKK